MDLKACPDGKWLSRGLMCFGWLGVWVHNTLKEQTGAQPTADRRAGFARKVILPRKARATCATLHLEQLIPHQSQHHFTAELTRGHMKKRR